MSAPADALTGLLRRTRPSALRVRRMQPHRARTTYVPLRPEPPARAR